MDEFFASQLSALENSSIDYSKCKCILSSTAYRERYLFHKIYLQISLRESLQQMPVGQITIIFKQLTTTIQKLVEKLRKFLKMKDVNNLY